MSIAETEGEATTATELSPSVGHLILEGISKSYGSDLVVDHVNLSIARGEIMGLLGPSGSGKSTLLRIVAGIITPNSGTVRLAERDITRTPMERRNIGVVFQSYALFPHMNVRANVGYGLKARRVAAKEVRRRVDELLELVRIEAKADAMPAELSGGQQQRVALARALAVEPDVLLLDEPLSNLDANLRADMAKEIRRVQREKRFTAVFVTHDRAEAFRICDRVAVLSDGTVAQLDTPQNLYLRPVSRFVADFIGPANWLTGVLDRADGQVVLRTADGAVPCPPHAGELGTGREVALLVRPELLRIGTTDSGPAPAGVNVLDAVVTELVYEGDTTLVTARTAAGTTFDAVTPGPPDGVRIGATIQLAWHTAATHVVAESR